MPVGSETRTTIMLCRHGESEGNLEQRFGGHSPTPLSALGRAQASAVGQALLKHGVDAIYTSDLVRAAQTADVIGSITGISPRVTSALRERSVGRFTDLTFAEARERFPEHFAALLRMEPHSSPPGGETYAACRERAALCLEQVLAEHRGRRLLLVSHHVTMTQLIMHILGVAPEAAAVRLLFQIDHCALHVFERNDAERWKIVALNERAHLSS